MNKQETHLALVKKWKKEFPAFYQDLKIVEKHLEDLYFQVSLYEIEYRQNKKKLYLDKADAIRKKIDDYLYFYEKKMLIATLSRN